MNRPIRPIRTLRRAIRAVSGGEQRGADDDAERVRGDQVPGGRDRDAQVVGDVGQQAHHHELGRADAESTHSEGEQGQGRGPAGGQGGRRRGRRGPGHQSAGPFEGCGGRTSVQFMFKYGTKAATPSIPPAIPRVTSRLPLPESSPAPRSADGRCPSRGSVQELTGSTPCTMIWSIRAIGNDAGQLNPKPSPAAPWVERIWAVTALQRAVVHRAVQVAEQDYLRVSCLVGDRLAQRVRAACRAGGR